MRNRPGGGRTAASARTGICAAVLTAALVGASGCAPAGRPVPSLFNWRAKASSSRPARPARTAQAVPSRLPLEDNPFAIRLTPGAPIVAVGVTVKAVQFDVLQVQAPLGEFSRSQKIWDHLDEQAVGTEMQMILQRNGLRVGLGTPESWPPVHAILQGVQRRIVRTLPPSPPNSVSVSLQLNNDPLDQTIFFFRPDRSLAGSSFPGATDVFRITWDFNSDNIEQVVVYLTPEIRQDQSGVTFKATPQGVAPVPVYEGRIFKELACRLVVSPGGYIVLGPGADVSHVGLLGREFLVTTIDGEPYEMILVIVPRVLDLSNPSGAEEGKAATPGK